MNNKEYIKESWINSIKYALFFTSIFSIPLAVFYYIFIYSQINSWSFFIIVIPILLTIVTLQSHFCFYFKNPNYDRQNDEVVN